MVYFFVYVVFFEITSSDARESAWNMHTSYNGVLYLKLFIAPVVVKSKIECK